MAKKKQQGHPANAPRRGKEVPRSPEETLAIGTLAMYEGTADLIRQSEALLIQAYRNGEDPAQWANAHVHLRASALGLLSLWSALRGLPDPCEAIAEGRPVIEVPE